MEFADDQDHVSAIEVQPDAPRERMLEEKILAKQAGERFDTVSVEYGQVAGYKMSLAKCYKRHPDLRSNAANQRPSSMATRL